MDLRPHAQTDDLPAEVRRLRRQLARERARREAAESIGEIPDPLQSLLLESAQSLEAVRIDDIEGDRRLDPIGADEIVAALGVRALAAVPIAGGNEGAGW